MLPPFVFALLLGFPCSGAAADLVEFLFDGDGLRVLPLSTKESNFALVLLLFDADLILLDVWALESLGRRFIGDRPPLLLLL